MYEKEQLFNLVFAPAVLVGSTRVARVEYISDEAVWKTNNDVHYFSQACMYNVCANSLVYPLSSLLVSGTCMVTPTSRTHTLEITILVSQCKH